MTQAMEVQMAQAPELTRRQFLELRCAEIQKEIDVLKAEAAKAMALETHLDDQRHYEGEVQKMISVHPDLAEEWKNVEHIYESLTGKPLMRTCDEKIFNRRDNVCTGCGSLPSDRMERARERLAQKKT